MKDTFFDVAVIGGGIVGLATAYKIQRAYPTLKLVVFEKEKELASHQTGHNSGVIHSGLYYKPGSYRATTCVKGRRELVQFCKEYKVAHDVCGKVVVAAEDWELPMVDKIFKRGKENDTEGIQKITAQEVADIEPHCKSVGGIYVPCTGIIDFVGTVNTLAELVKSINTESEVLTECEFFKYHKEGELNLIQTSKGQYSAKKLVFCGGLQSDRLAKKDNIDSLSLIHI